VAENKAAIENCAFDRNRDINIIIDRKLIFIFILIQAFLMLLAL
jgi:hypothetical protein